LEADEKCSSSRKPFTKAYAGIDEGIVKRKNDRLSNRPDQSTNFEKAD
jgi:hypothetical protein